MAASFLAENRAMQLIRARVAFHTRQHGFDRCMQQILDPDRSITGNQVAELYAAWGDPLTPADEQFLRSAVAESGIAQGPILLAGASLLTLLLGALCTKRRPGADPQPGADQVWCLEESPHWANVIRSWLAEYRISRAHVIQSPARLFKDHVWYVVDPKRLAPAYGLVICDGGRSSPRGVVGAVQRLSAQLGERFTILARNVREPSALRTLQAWAGERNARIALIDKRHGFVKLTRKGDETVRETQSGMAATTGTRQPVANRHGR